MIESVWVVWVVCILPAVVGFVVIYRDSRWLNSYVEESSFLSSVPPFDKHHIDKHHIDKESPGVQWQKHYRTESGLTVVILTTGKPGPFPVAGYILTTGAQLQWDKFGKTQNTESGLNLVEVSQ
jgi:hypothetical protein